MKPMMFRGAAIVVGVLSLFLAGGCGEEVSQTSSPTAVDLRILVTSQNGVPLTGAKVASQEQPEGQLKITGLTGNDGRVTFTGITTGNYTIDVSRFDYELIETTREISVSDHDFTVSLKPSATAPPTSTPTIVTFGELIAQPESFNNRAITVDAYCFFGFEISTLAAELTGLCSNPRVIPVQPLIWVTGDLGQSVYQSLQQQTDTPSGYAEKFGHIRVTGIFQSGKFGHLDAYNFQITVTAAAILP